MTIAPDRWLREALRHAPDHDQAVPQAVREHILQAARRHALTARVVPSQVPRRWWAFALELWQRPARLGYSGALVAVLVAGVWGIDRLDEQARQAPAHLSPVHPSRVHPSAPARQADAAPAPHPAPAPVPTTSPTPTPAPTPAPARLPSAAQTAQTAQAARIDGRGCGAIGA